MKRYTRAQLNLSVENAIKLIKNSDFPIMASRVWDIYRAHFPECPVVKRWALLPDNGNAPDFNEVLRNNTNVKKVKVGRNTYYMVR